MSVCLLCSSTLGEIMLTITKPDRFEEHIGVKSESYQRHWMACNNCGAAINVTEPSLRKKLNELSTQYYEVDFKNSDIKSKYDTIMSMPEKESDNAGRVNRILSFFQRWRGFPSQLSALDIGAGTGVFLAKLLQKSSIKCDALGIEPDPRAAEHLKALNLFKVYQGLFTGQSEFKNYNLITLNKVIEHIENPRTVLIQALAALSQTYGFLYVEVPDKQTIFNRPPHDNILGCLHFHLYDPTSLGLLLKSCGLEVVEISRVLEPSGKITTFAFATSKKIFGELCTH